jgi:glyoxylate reductase
MTKIIYITQKMPDVAIIHLQAIAAEENWQIDYRDQESPATPIEIATGVKNADAIWCTLGDRLDENALVNANKLKMIANFAVGYNNIDINYARKKNILISNTPDVLTNATAELTVTLILNTLRRIKETQNYIAQDKWKYWAPTLFLGEEIKDKTIGIFGMGRIGQRVADICSAGFGAKIIYHNRSDKKDCQYQWVSLEVLLKNSDIICSLCPLTNETRGFFNEKLFLQMKKDSFFINASRGELHDEMALLKMINLGHLKGAGLDVTNPEPPAKDSPILNHPKIFVTPHIGSASLKARTEMGILCAQNIKAALLNGPLLSPV